MTGQASADNAASLRALIGSDEEVVVITIDGKEVKFHLKAPTAMQVAEIGDKYKNNPHSKGIDIEILAACLRLPPDELSASWSNNSDYADKLLAPAYRLAGFPQIADSISNPKSKQGKSRLQEAADKGVTLGPGATIENEDKGEVNEPNPLSSK